MPSESDTTSRRVREMFDDIVSKLVEYRARELDSHSEDFQLPFTLQLLHKESGKENSTTDYSTQCLSLNTTSTDDLKAFLMNSRIIKTSSDNDNNNTVYLEPIYCSLPFNIDIRLFIYLTVDDGWRLLENVFGTGPEEIARNYNSIKSNMESISEILQNPKLRVGIKYENSDNIIENIHPHYYDSLLITIGCIK